VNFFLNLYNLLVLLLRSLPTASLDTGRYDLFFYSNWHGNFKLNDMVLKNFISFSILLILLIVSCNNNPNGYYVQPVYVYPGVGLGTIVAVVISWSRNKSIIWAIIHGILGWLYVIYALLVPKKD